MTVTLGGIALSDDLVLQGLESRPMGEVSVTYLLGGKAVVQHDPVDQVYGVPLSLAGEYHFTLAEIKAVQGLVGQEVELVHHRGTFQVVVLGVPDEPETPVSNPTDAEWYSGEISMITV